MGKDKLTFTASLWREGEYVIAKCVELGVASFGDNREDALENLQEAVELYLENEDIEEIVSPEIVKIEVG